MMRQRNIALGCAGVAVTIALVVVAVLGWRVSLHFRAIREDAAVRARVAATPFTAPGRGVVSEDRLRIFLEVCRRMEPLDRKYQKARADLHQANEHDTIDLNALAGSMAYVQEMQVERARALEALGMGMRELRWIMLRLGETAWGVPESPGTSTDDRINAPLFEKYVSDITACIDLKGVREDLDNYRRAIRDGSP
jgi:hypothetical protein